MQKVKWSELFPHQFLQQQKDTPIVYLPLGICEPHGRGTILGLDLIKAEWLCEHAAQRFGGIVAPSLGYQIHESGYHAPWLAEVVGNVNAMMTSMPPHVMLYFFLYQLRAFNNAGFKAAIVVTGHAGGNEVDYRLAAECFMQVSKIRVKVFADPELVAGQFYGDHAGQYEISQLLYLKEEGVSAVDVSDEYKLGRFALGADAHKASKEMGERIMEACLQSLEEQVAVLRPQFDISPNSEITYCEVESVWQELLNIKTAWLTARTRPHQDLAPEDSIWKKYETVKS